MRSNMRVQRAQVMRGLRALGAQVLPRVQQVRNAAAVRLNALRMDAAPAVPGARAVRLVRKIQWAPPALQDVALGKSRGLVLNLPESLPRNPT